MGTFYFCQPNMQNRLLCPQDVRARPVPVFAGTMAAGFSQHMCKRVGNGVVTGQDEMQLRKTGSMVRGL